MPNQISALASRRMTAGYTQESLAERLSVERSTIARWEHGESKPQPWARRKLAEVLSVSLQQVDDLLCDSTNARAAPRIAISGSRAPGTDADAIDRVVPALARFVLTCELDINHGPVGVGIEVMTYIADRYRPADFTMTASLFGRGNVVRDTRCVLVVGGASGTSDEIDLAVSMGTLVIPYPPSGGSAHRFYESAKDQRGLRAALPGQIFEKLGHCQSAEDYIAIVRQALTEGGIESR